LTAQKKDAGMRFKAPDRIVDALNRVLDEVRITIDAGFGVNLTPQITAYGGNIDHQKPIEVQISVPGKAERELLKSEEEQPF